MAEGKSVVCPSCGSDLVVRRVQDAAVDPATGDVQEPGGAGWYLTCFAGCAESRSWDRTPTDTWPDGAAVRAALAEVRAPRKKK